MKKREKKLDFHRDTLRNLDPTEPGFDKIAGGSWSSESQPCCGTTVDTGTDTGGTLILQASPLTLQQQFTIKKPGCGF